MGKPAAFKKVKPTLTSSRVKPNRVDLSWESAGTGAMVYRATAPNGKYKLIKKTKKTSYTDKVSKKKDYLYKLKVYLKYKKKTYVSKFSGSEWKFVTKPVKPKNVKAVKAKKGVKLTWKQSKACGHFSILRSEKKNGKYEAIGYSSGDYLKYPDKTAKRGKTYFYKVQADNYMDWSGKIKGTNSAVVKIKA